MKLNSYLIIYLFILFSTPVLTQPVQKIADIGNLTLTKKKIIFNCRIGYRTLGRINDDSTNVIIYPSWFEGTSEDIYTLIEKYNFIDTNKFFIIAIDALGNGISTSSSNYEDEYPQITVRDMVNSQYKFLAENLDLKHIYGAVGGSMGGMQVLEWAAAYPGYIDKIVSYSGTPKMSSYDLLWMNTLLEVIQNLKEEGVSEKEIIKIKNMMIAIVGRTPDYVNEKINVDDFQSYRYSFEKDPSDVFTLDDFVIQFKAIMDHDILKEFNNSYKELAEKIKAKMFIIVSKTDMMVNPTESIKLADVLGCRKLILNNNCGHLAPSCEIERVRGEINKFLMEE